MSLYRHLATSCKKLTAHFGIELSRRRPLRDPIDHFCSKLGEFGVQTIFDVGANKGQFGLAMMKNRCRATLVSFEPMVEAHSVLVENAAKFPSWIVHERTALGATEESTTINVSENGASSSLFEVNQISVDAAKGSAISRTEQISVTRFDTLEHAKFPKPWAMKVDTQGFELEVLKGVGKLLPHIEVLLIEMSLVQLYKDGVGFADLFQWLENKGYKCIGITQGFANHSTNELLQIDGLFVKNPEITDD